MMLTVCKIMQKAFSKRGIHSSLNHINTKQLMGLIQKIKFRFGKKIYQNGLNDNEVLYFLHIPKTAGTTFSAILDGFFDKTEIFPKQVWPELSDVDLANFQYKFIRGHFGYGLHNLLNKKIVYITMLRDPKSRIISNYDHMIQFPIDTNWAPDNFISKNESLLDVLQNQKKRIIFVDVQTRELGLELDKINNNSIFEMVRVKNNYLLDANETSLDYDYLLKKAKVHLSTCAYFGITERFEDSLFLLYYTFGWRPIRQDWRLMKTGITNKDSISQELMIELDKCTKFDMKLYNFAKDLFEFRFSKMVDDLKRSYYDSTLQNLSFSEMMYELLERHYANCLGKSNLIQKHSINFDFNQKFFGTGWYHREQFPNGIGFRWMGPQLESSIDFVLCSKNDLKIRFRMVYEVAHNNLEKLLVNGHTIKLVSHAEGDGIPKTIEQLIFNNNKESNKSGIEYEGLIPNEYIKQNNFTRFTFKMKQVAELPGPRFVSGIIDRIVIEPIRK